MIIQAMQSPRVTSTATAKPTSLSGHTRQTARQMQELGRATPTSSTVPPTPPALFWTTSASPGAMQT